MGVDTVSWRINIGSFSVNISYQKSSASIMSPISMIINLDLRAVLMLVLTIVTCGNVELNPGPAELVCYECKRSFHDCVVFKSHMQTHELLGQLSRPVKCAQPSCSSYFQKLFNLFRHIQKYHSHTSVQQIYNLLDSTQNIKFWNTTSVYNFQVDTEFETDRPMGDNSVNLKAIVNKQTDNLTVQSQAISMVASLRANSGIACYVIPDIVNSCQSMINNTIEGIKNHILRLIPLSADFSFKINDICNKYFNTLEFLSTKYKQDLFFESNPNFVKAEECSFGDRKELKGEKFKTIYNTFQYISIERNVRSLLSNKAYMQMLLANMEKCPNRSLVAEFCVGETFAFKFKNGDKLTILLQLL